MNESSLDIVTGATGFTGRYITRRLLNIGRRVISLSGHHNRASEFGDAVQVKPYNFDNPAQLTQDIKGADVLYNTYWIRFPMGDMTYKIAKENTANLIQSAVDAGVRRIVHISIANPSKDSPLPYYSGKAEVEEIIQKSGLSYAILRPATIFGDKGILINNIAYFLRHFPAFGIPGSGEYGFRPIYVDDLAALAVKMGEGDENITLDAVGPEYFTFNEVVNLIKDVTGARATILHLPPFAALLATMALGKIVGDVVLTKDEVTGLCANLLASDAPANGETKLSDWLRERADSIGREYMSETKRHYLSAVGGRQSAVRRPWDYQ